MKYAIDSLLVILIFTIFIYFTDKSFLSSTSYLLAVLISLLVALLLNGARYIVARYGHYLRKWRR